LTAHTVCPHCARPLDAVGQVSRDHAVPRALGGTVKVRACKRCNDVLGGGVEARLLASQSWLTLLAQAHGLTPGRLTGAAAAGAAIRSHFGTGEHRLHSPEVEVVAQDENVVHVTAKVAPEMADKLIRHLEKRFGGKAQAVSREAAPEETFSYRLSMNIRDLRRLAAKIALCGGARQWGDDYLLSPLADWMRVVLDVWSDWPVEARPAPLEAEHAGGDWPMSVDELEGLTGQAQRLFSPILAGATTKELPDVDVGLRSPIVLFVPVAGGQQTMFSAVVLGLVLPVLAVPHALPAAARERATVLVDL
jgi:hypothetical protein